MCVCLEENREVFTHVLAVMAKVETHIPWQPLWWFWRAGNSVQAGESPNLHPVSLTDSPSHTFVGESATNCGGFCFQEGTRQKAAFAGAGRAGHLSTAALGTTSQNLHFLGCTEEGSTWDFCTSQPWCANHISLSAGWIIARLRIMSTVITEVWHS